MPQKIFLNRNLLYYDIKAGVIMKMETKTTTTRESVILDIELSKQNSIFLIF